MEERELDDEYWLLSDIDFHKERIRSSAINGQHQQDELTKLFSKFLKKEFN